MTWSPAARRVLDEAGPTMSVPEVGQVLGISKWTAYDLAKRGELGVQVLRLGARLRVPTADVRRKVGLGPGDAA